MATKIKTILERTPSGGVLTSNWLARNGIPRGEQTSYVRTGWLERLSRGIYHLANEECRLFPTLYCIEQQTGKTLHIGAFTALDLKGFTHYGQLGTPKAFIYTKDSKNYLDWIKSLEWDMNPVINTGGAYGDIGLMPYETEGVNLTISSPERAIFECLDLIPKYANPMDLYYIMEMLTTLRPKIIISLLDASKSFVTKRLFLYMAEKAKHQWFSELDLSHIDIGKGDRSIATGGSYISKYKIVIPKELAEYE